MPSDNLKDVIAHFQGTAPFAVGDIVEHPEGYRVIIADGAYLRNGRVSNFWGWFRVDAEGRPLGERKSGYGWNSPAADAVTIERETK